MKRICLDSTVLIHAHRAADGSEAEKDRKCRTFLLKMEEEGAEILVPAACIAELLVQVPEEDWEKVAHGLTKAYQVVPFDTSAAIRTGAIHRARLDDKTIAELRAEPARTTKAKLKFDLMILGTAISRRAEVLYAEDNDFPRLARGEITCAHVPVIHRQLPLKTEDGKAMVTPLRGIKGGKGRR